MIAQLEATGQYGDIHGTSCRLRHRHGRKSRHPGHGRKSATRTPPARHSCSPRPRSSRSGKAGRCVDYLDDLGREFGYYRNELLNIVMTGLEGKENMATMLDALRKSPPREIGGLPVTAFEDLRDESGRLGPFQGETDTRRPELPDLPYRRQWRTRGEGLSAPERYGTQGEGLSRSRIRTVQTGHAASRLGEDLWRSRCPHPTPRHRLPNEGTRDGRPNARSRRGQAKPVSQVRESARSRQCKTILCWASPVVGKSPLPRCPAAPLPRGSGMVI